MSDHFTTLRSKGLKNDYLHKMSCYNLAWNGKAGKLRSNSATKLLKFKFRFTEIKSEGWYKKCRIRCSVIYENNSRARFCFFIVGVSSCKCNVIFSNFQLVTRKWKNNSLPIEIVTWSKINLQFELVALKQTK